MSRRLRLHHEILLMALHDRKGTTAFGSMIEYGLGGAVFLELLLEERVRIVREGRRWKRDFVEVLDASPTHDAAMDAALEKLNGLKQRGNPRDTVTRIGHLPKLPAVVARDLCRKGVLRETEQELLLLFRRKVYPTVDPRPEKELLSRVRGALEGDGTVDDRTAALIALADVAGTLAEVYSRKDRRRLKPRIRAFSASGVGPGAGDAGGSARVAVATAMKAAIAASTAASGG